MRDVTEGTLYLAAVYVLYDSGEERFLYSAGGYDLRGSKEIVVDMARRMAISPATPSRIIAVYGDVVEIRMDTRKIATIYRVTYDRSGKMSDVDDSVDNW